MRNKSEVLTKFAEFIYMHIQGGTTDNLMDADWLEEVGVMSVEEYEAYETELCEMFDYDFFCCSGCGWILPIEEMSDADDKWECYDCGERV